MEYRSLSVAAFLIALNAPLAVTWASSEASPEQMADWNRRLAKAKELKEEARAQKAAAETVFAAKDKACFEKFQVNACRDQVRLEHARLTTEARRVDNEGKALERQVKKEQLADKDARYLDDADERAAELKARENETATLRARSQESEAARRSDKDQKAIEGQQRRAEDAERLQKKQAEHAAKVAKKMEEAQRRQAEGVAR